MAKIRKPVAKKTKFVKIKVPKSKFKVPKMPKIKSTLKVKRWK